MENSLIDNKILQVKEQVYNLSKLRSHGIENIHEKHENEVKKCTLFHESNSKNENKMNWNEKIDENLNEMNVKDDENIIQMMKQLSDLFNQQGIVYHSIQFPFLENLLLKNNYLNEKNEKNEKINNSSSTGNCFEEWLSNLLNSCIELNDRLYRYKTAANDSKTMVLSQIQSKDVLLKLNDELQMKIIEHNKQQQKSVLLINDLGLFDILYFTMLSYSLFYYVMYSYL